MTHDAPSYHPYGFALLDDLARTMGVKALVHGHHHDRLDSTGHWSGQGFASIGIGLRGISAVRLGPVGVEVDIVQTVELDGRRVIRNTSHLTG